MHSMKLSRSNSRTASAVHCVYQERCSRCVWCRACVCCAFGSTKSNRSLAQGRYRLVRPHSASSNKLAFDPDDHFDKAIGSDAERTEVLKLAPHWVNPLLQLMRFHVLSGTCVPRREQSAVYDRAENGSIKRTFGAWVERARECAR